jgi:hypothetical protein
MNMIARSSGNIINSQFRRHKLGALASYFVIFVLAFTSLRGWVILNLKASPEIVYGFSSMLIIALALYGFNCRFRIKDSNLTSLRNLLIVNLFFGIYYIICAKLLGGSIDVTFFYLYFLPYILFLFLRISVEKLHVGLFLIFIGISFSTIDNFIISLTGVDGLAYLEEYNAKLRPLVFDAMSRTGAYLRVGGYTASYHDSANILGMLGSYYYVKSMIFNGRLKIVSVICAITALGAMTFTQSAANIILALLTCFIFSIYIAVIKHTVGIGIWLLIIAFIVTFIVSIFPEVLVFSDRVGADGDWGNIKKNITMEIILSLHFWIGHAYIAVGEDLGTEAAFLSGILRFGIVPACLLYWVLIYPAYVFFATKSRSLASLPYLAAIVFGFFSLAHYGSLFRVTNIAIFYAMYALFFINVNTGKESKWKIS